MSPAPAKIKKRGGGRPGYWKLTREEALNILIKMPFLVAASPGILPTLAGCLRGQTPVPIWVEFEVVVGRKRYMFESQPFQVIRQITLEEYRAAAPWAASFGGKLGRWLFYEIHTD